MATMNIYSVPGSPFLASVLWAMDERGAPYVVHALTPGETKQAAHLARHPFGRMPAIEHDGFTLYETQAILRYVADAFAGPALQPADARSRARMNQLIGINDWYFFPKVSATVVFERVIKPNVLKQPADEVRVKDALPMARTCVAEIAHLMGKQPFLAGDALSLADLHLAPQFYYFAMTPEGSAILGEHTTLKAWLTRMTSRPSARKTMLFGIDRAAA